MKVPYRCKRNGYACAYRTRFSGGDCESACGYMYYTGKQRGCSVKDCDKWIGRLPRGLKQDDKRDINEDIPDCAYSTEHSGGDNELYAAGL